MSIQQPRYSARKTSQCGDEIYEQRCPLPCRNNALWKNNLRTEWPHEARDFTLWLEKNINALSCVIGMPIQIEGREVSIGRLRADLVGREIRSRGLVIIENQLNKTDHEHLGKLLTYAANIDAKVLIWVAPKIRIEHRKVLEGLNNKTNKYFFGIEIELFQIEGPLSRSVKQAVRPEKAQFNLFPIVESPPDNTPKLEQLINFSIFSQIEDTSQLIQISEFPQRVLKLNVVVAPKTIASPSTPTLTTRQSPPFRSVRSQHYASPSTPPRFMRQPRKPRQDYQKTNSRRSSRLRILPYIFSGVGAILYIAKRMS